MEIFLLYFIIISFLTILVTVHDKKISKKQGKRRISEKALIILAIMGFIGAWNDYTSIWLFAPSYPTIGVAIKNVIDNVNEYGHPVLFSIMLISIVPVIAVFIAFQNTIMNHFIVGGLKG